MAYVTPSKVTLLAVVAVVLAACGSSSSSPSSSGTGSAGPKVARGAITATSAGAIEVNGIQLSTAGAIVKIDDAPRGADDLRVGMVVTVHGRIDDRTGTATEIEFEHGIEGRVDDKGTDFVVVGGTRVQVDDTAHLDDRLGGFDAIGVGSVVAVSGVPVAGIPGALDDHGGLRASRLDVSRRQDDGSSANDHDLDVKGFVANLSATSFELRLTPDAASWYVVDTSAVPTASLANGSSVEVHTTSAPVPGTPPVIATLVASSIQLEDRLGEGEAELEGYVTSGSGSRFVVDGVTVETDGATVYELGTAADVIPGAKLEAEGSLDAQGILHAHRISFRPGVRLTGVVSGYTGTSMTILGKLVQIPSYLDDDFGGTLGNGARIEVRALLAAHGTDLVAYRIVDPSGGNASRAFVRAVVTAKSSADPLHPSFTVLGFDVTTANVSPVNGYHLVSGDAGVSASTFYAAVTPGVTVVKVRAASASDVSGGAWAADELEIEGTDH